MRYLPVALIALLVIIIGGVVLMRRDGEEPVREPASPQVTARTDTLDRAEAEFETYTNERFGFSVAYPPAVFTSIDRSQNGDGALLSSAPGEVALRAFASHNVLDKTWTDLKEEARADFSRVESEEGRQGYAVLRGPGPDGRRLVERVELRDGKVFRLTLSYPKGALEDRTARSIVSSFDVNTGDAPTGFLVKVALLDYPASGGQYDKTSDGPERGCDRVVLVDRNVPRTNAPLTAALNELFSMEETDVDGWQNFIAKTSGTLSFDRAVVADSTASIYLTGRLSGLGGVCDNPRAAIQIEETALHFPTVNDVQLYLNGTPTDLHPDGRGR